MSEGKIVTYLPTKNLIPIYLNNYWHITTDGDSFYPLCRFFSLRTPTTVTIYVVKNFGQLNLGVGKYKEITNVTDLTLRREDQYSQDYKHATYCFILSCLSESTQHTITITNTVDTTNCEKNTLSVEHKEHKKEETKKEAP